MGGSLVTVLILLILDSVVCSPRILRDSPHVAKNLGTVSKLSEELNTNNAEVNTEVNTELPDSNTLADHEELELDNIQEACHDENGCGEQLPGRSLKVGDTFTPQEMLPIATELLRKVGKPGEGKGIVSSVSNPQILADTLFENYFMTMKRIVTLQSNDISGLDALQALSLSGKKVNMAVYVSSITVPPPPKIIGESNLNNTKTGRSKYKVLTKEKLKFGPPGPRFKASNRNKLQNKGSLRLQNKRERRFPKKRDLRFPKKRDRRLTKKRDRRLTKKRDRRLPKKVNRRLPKKGNRRLPKKRNRKFPKKRGLKFPKKPDRKFPKKGDRRFSIRELADKTLAKKRKLVIKARRNKRNQRLKTKKRVPKSKKRKSKTALKNTKDASEKNKVCRWRYVCTNPADQNTCHVYPDCITNNKNDKYIGERNDKKAKTLEKFRRMINIDPIDEEVGKIMERHTLTVKAQEAEAMKIETLGEYFDKLIKREAMKDKSSTKAMLRRPTKKGLH